MVINSLEQFQSLLWLLQPYLSPDDIEDKKFWVYNNLDKDLRVACDPCYEIHKQEECLLRASCYDTVRYTSVPLKCAFCFTYVDYNLSLVSSIIREIDTLIENDNISKEDFALRLRRLFLSLQSIIRNSFLIKVTHYSPLNLESASYWQICANKLIKLSNIKEDEFPWELL